MPGAWMSAKSCILMQYVVLDILLKKNHHHYDLIANQGHMLSYSTCINVLIIT